MGQEFYCTIGNRAEQSNIPISIAKLSIKYDTIDKDVRLSDEDAQALADLIRDRMMEIFVDVTEVFPEISELDITITEEDS
jgi:hypothetical protein